MIERIFWNEDRLEEMKGLRFMNWQRLGDRVLSIHIFVFGSKLKLTRRLGKERDGIFNMEGIVFVDPLFKEPVRNL